MPTLSLTPDQSEALRGALESYLSDMSVEIADTDRMEFREMLKAKRELLREVLDQLG